MASKPKIIFTNGYILKRLKTFSETSKWILTGTVAILFFTYDKIDNRVLTIISFLFGGVTIICLTAAYLGFKRSADYLEDQMETNDKIDARTGGGRIARKPYSAQLPATEVWPQFHHKNYYRPGVVAFVIYALGVFIAVAFQHKKKELQRSVVYNQLFPTSDTAGKWQIPYQTGETIPIKNIVFDVNKSELKPASFRSLNQVIDTLLRYPELRIEIRAHTDDVGTDSYNQVLSERRAKSVVDYLSTQVGIDRLSWQGFGETMPLLNEKTEKARSLNRRVEFIVLKN